MISHMDGDRRRALAIDRRLAFLEINSNGDSESQTDLLSDSDSVSETNDSGHTRSAQLLRRMCTLVFRVIQRISRHAHNTSGPVLLEIIWQDIQSVVIECMLHDNLVTTAFRDELHDLL